MDLRMSSSSSQDWVYMQFLIARQQAELTKFFLKPNNYHDSNWVYMQFLK